MCSCAMPTYAECGQIIHRDIFNLDIGYNVPCIYYNTLRGTHIQLV